MVKPKRLQAILALALLAGSMLGCQASPPNAHPVAPKLPAALVAPFGIRQANQLQESDPLNLTETQRQQLEAISREAQQNGRSAELQQILLGPTIGTAALRALLIQRDTELDQAVATQLKLRNLLTPEQRQRLIQASQQQAQTAPTPPTDSQMQALQQQLNLTPEQMRAMTGMNTALQAHDDAHRSSLQQAYLTLIETGDGSAYRQALAESNRTTPIDAMVAFYASLSQAQRQRLFSTQNDSQSGG